MDTRRLTGLGMFGFGMIALGAMAMGGGCSSGCCCCCDEDGDDNEVMVGMAELPAAVRTTLQNKTAGGTVGEIERETENGRTVYAAEATMNGEKWEIVIAEDGSIVRTEREEGEDD